MASAEGVGDRIMQALQAAGMKQAELARRLKVSQPTVYGWVNQVHGITWENARRVAAVLKVAPGWIMFGADEEAKRIAQTAEELAFLRLFRELDDSDHVSLLRLLTAMQRSPSSIPSHHKGPDPPRPPVGGSASKSEPPPCDVVPIRARRGTHPERRGR